MPVPEDPNQVLADLAAGLVQKIGAGVRAVETPQLGRVEYNGVAELTQALNLLTGLLATAQGGASRTQSVIATRGLWPSGNEGRYL